MNFLIHCLEVCSAVVGNSVVWCFDQLRKLVELLDLTVTRLLAWFADLWDGGATQLPDSGETEGAASPKNRSAHFERVEWIVGFVYESLAGWFRFVAAAVPLHALSWPLRKSLDAAITTIVVVVSGFQFLGFRLAQWLLPDWLLWRFRDTYLVVRDATVDFLASWTASRDYRRLLLALPAMAVGTAMVAAACFVPSSHDTLVRYNQSLQAAMEDGDSVRQQLCLQKIRQLGGGEHSDHLQYRAICKMAEDGDVQLAAERMLKLSPDHAQGHLGGHLWLANALLQERIGLELDETTRWQRIARHVGHAASIDPAHVAVKRLSVELDLRFERHESAVATMNELADQFPEMHLELMHYFAERDRWRAKRHAMKVVRQYRDQLGEPEFQQHRVLAECLLDTQATSFRSYSTMVDESPPLEITLDTVVLEESIKIAATQGTGAESEVAYDTDVEDPFARMNVQRPSAKAMKFLQRGDAYCLANDFEQAAAMYLSACDAGDASGLAWNNLAWIWSNKEPTQLENALEAATRAIAVSPHPRIYETRGQILVKLGRWEEAVDDLELALHGSQDIQQKAHSLLAVAHKSLGNIAEANSHQTAIGRLR